MDPFKILIQVICLCLISTGFTTNVAKVPFNENYIVNWGGDHVTLHDHDTKVQILIDPHSGGGFRSKYAYGSGFFKMNIKVPRNDAGIVTTFYLTSEVDNAPGGNHDELDLEFLGGPPYKLSTNIFAQDYGHREQIFKLWFDPTLAFHEYKILWNQYQIVFWVDGVPIRVLKNDGKSGLYPKLPMYVHASLWNATKWIGSTDWSRGPFIANYRGFKINGCPYDNSNPTKCDSTKYSWNTHPNRQLNSKQKGAYEKAKKMYMEYDYCKADSAHIFPECYTS